MSRVNSHSWRNCEKIMILTLSPSLLEREREEERERKIGIDHHHTIQEIVQNSSAKKKNQNWERGERERGREGERRHGIESNQNQV